MNQKGFILPPLGIGVYGAIAAAVVILGLGIGIKVQTSRLTSCKQEFATFQAQVKALGEVAAAKAKAQETADKLAKEKADHENQALRADNAALSKRLRDARARSSYVPAAAAGSSHPDAACFSRADLERAIQQLDGAVQSLIEQGDQARIDLNTAKSWAASIKPTP